jgi:hypothetical protein
MPPVVVAVAAGAAAVAAGASVLAAVAIGVGTIALTKALTPDFDLDSVDPVAEQNFTTSSNQPRRIIYGENVVGGQLIGYSNPDINGDPHHVMAIHIAGHPCESVELYEIEGRTPQELGDAVTLEPHLGEQTTGNETAQRYIEGWTAQHVGFGLTNVYLQVRIDEELFPNGVNEIKFRVKGKRVYDPRLDSTIGGSGSHRADDESTWTYSNNPQLCTYDYIRYHGYMPIPHRRIPWDFVALTANYCDEQAEYEDTNGSTQTETRFTCNGVLNNALRIGEGLRTLMSSMGAKIYRPNGRIFVKPAMYLGPAVVTVTPADFAEQPEYQPHRPERERCNTVRCQYVEPNLKYQVTDAPVVASQRLLDKDGVPLEHPLRLPMTQSSTTAQRLGNLYLERNAAGFVTSAMLRHIRLDITPGSVIRYVDAESNITREFIVDDYRVNVRSRMTEVTLEEDSPLLYPDDFRPSETDLTPNTTLRDIGIVEAVENLAYFETPNDSFRQGVITWSHPVPASVFRYQIDIRLANNSLFRSFSASLTRADISHLPIDNYTICVRAVGRIQLSEERCINTDITQEQTPTANASIIIEPGIVIVTPPAPPAINQEYELVYTDNPALNPDADSLNLFIAKLIGKSFNLTGLKDGVPYFIFYRLVTESGSAQWVRVTAVAKGIAAEQIDADVLFGDVIAEIDTTDIRDDIDALFTDVIRDSIARTNARVEQARQVARNERTQESIDALELSVNDEEQGLFASFTRINEAFTTIEGQAVALEQVNLNARNETERLDASIERISLVESNTNGNAQALQLVTVQVNNQANDISASVDRITLVETDANNNASALDAVVAEIQDPSRGLEASFRLAQQADIATGLNQSSLTFIRNDVRNLEAGLSATTAIAQEARTTGNGNASALISLQSRVSDTEQEASASLSLATDLDTELNQLRALAILSVQANGNAAAIRLGATPTQSQIIFDAEQFLFVHNNIQLFAIDSQTNKVTVNATLQANNIEGDVIDARIKRTTAQSWRAESDARELVSFTVTAAPFTRVVTVPNIFIEIGTGGLMSFRLSMRSGSFIHDGFIENSYQETSQLVTRPLHDTLAANTERTYFVLAEPVEAGNAICHAQNLEIKVYKQGASIL